MGVIYSCVCVLLFGVAILTEEQLPISPYLNRRLRSIEEAEEDVRRLRDRLRKQQDAHRIPPPTADIIPFPQR